MGLAGDVWAPQQAWCKQHDIESIALTLPGHGDRRDDVISIEAMADEIVSLACSFPKVILVGHSFGGLLCALAAPKIQSIETVILINPLLDPAQIKWLFFASVKVARVMQWFFGAGSRPGKFIQGAKWFWRWGIYPYCLMCNNMENLEKLYLKIKILGRVSLPSITSCIVLLSCIDEMLKPATSEHRLILPVAGHMLFRLAPDEINRFLAQAVLRREEHRA